MASIPPLSTGAGPAAGQGTDANRLARTQAQRAFFQAALGGAQAAAPTTAHSQEPVQPARRAQAPQQQDEGAPERILRPGSLVNIVV